MLSIKVEPEDTPTWEERDDRGIIQEGHADGTGIDDATFQVTVHIEDDEFLTEATENKITVVIKEEDSDQGQEGSDKSPHHQLSGHQMQSSVTHPIYVSDIASGNTGVSGPSSESIVNDDPCTQLSSSQQLEGHTSGRQRNSFYQVPNEENMQNTMELEPVHIVNQCQLSENFVSNLDISENICTHERSFKCKLCEKSFSRKSASNELETNCTEAEKQFQLNLCNKSSRRKCNLKMYAISHIGKETFICQYCEKEFDTLDDCQTHEMMHTDGKPFMCQFCDNSFKRKGDCKLHEMTHTGEKPFKCQFCEKSFRRKQDWKYHEMTHICEKPFKCQFCKKSFSNMRACKNHERTHTGNRLFLCQFCDKGFTLKQRCKIHEMTHTSEKPFKCQYCEKAFKRKQEHKYHEMIHTGEKPFKCQYCEKPFIRKEDCKRHMRRHCNMKLQVRNATSDSI